MTPVQWRAALLVTLMLTGCGDPSSTLNPVGPVTPQLGAVAPVNVQTVLGQPVTTAVTLTNAGTAPLTYTVSSPAPWLTVQGGATGTITPGGNGVVQLKAECVTNDDFQTVLSIAVQGGATTTVPVTLRCGELSLVTADPPPINLTALVGAAAQGSFGLRNTGATPLSYTLTNVPTWITIAEGRTGTLGAAQTGQVSFAATCSPDAVTLSTQLAAQYDSGRTLSIPISLTCKPDLTKIQVSKTQASFDLVGAEGRRDTYTLSNTGTAPVSYTTRVQLVSPPPPTAGKITVVSGGSGMLEAGAVVPVTYEVLCGRAAESLVGLLITEVGNQQVASVQVKLNCAPSPASFSFTPLLGPNVVIGGRTWSESVTLAGFEGTLPLKVKGGLLSVSGQGPATPGPVMVRAGDVFTVGIDTNKDDTVYQAEVQLGALPPVYFQATTPKSFFQPPQKVDGAEQRVRVDLNSDGRLDLVEGKLGDYTAGVRASLLNSDGTYTITLQDYHNPASYYLLDVSDINSDNKIDLISANNYDGRSPNVRYGRGDGTFEPDVPLPAGINLSDNARPVVERLVDLNGDGLLDRVRQKSGPSNTIQIFIGTPTGEELHSQYQTYPYSNLGGEPYFINLIVEDYNNDGLADIYGYFGDRYGTHKQAVYLGKM